MNKLKLFLMAGILAFSVQQSSAQLTLGGEAGYTIGGGVLSNINLGLRADYQLGDKSGAFGGISFLLPNSYESDVYVTAHSSTVNPMQKTAASKVKIGGTMIHAQYKRFFFGGEYKDGFGFYGGVGIALNLFTYKETITGSYDSKVYSAPNGFENDVYKELAPGFSINFGIGFDVANRDGNAFHLETFLNLPANQANGQDIEVIIPASINLRLGYRFAL